MRKILFILSLCISSFAAERDQASTREEQNPEKEVSDYISTNEPTSTKDYEAEADAKKHQKVVDHYSKVIR